jgi:hypothetical protein
MKVKQILVYTRPWEDDFHIALAKRLQEVYPDAPVRFISFFISSVRKVKQAGFDALYFPDELRKVSGDEISAERFAEIDRNLYETGGANFNLMLHSERFLPESAEAAELFGKKHLVVLDRLITEGTLSTSSMYDHFVYWLAGGLANARQGWHFAFVGCGAPAGRSVALKTPWETWRRDGMTRTESSELLGSSRVALSIPVLERNSYMKPQLRRNKHLRERYRLFLDIIYDKKAGSYFWDTFISFDKWLLEKILPASVFKKIYLYPEPTYSVKIDHDIVIISNKYVYLPLHYEPEAVILMYSPWLRDQSEVVRLVSQALPVGWKILVKDHPNMVGLRNPKFYANIKAIPHVQLVATTVSSTVLMTHSEAVVVLAGTSAIEARLMGKKAISLGSPPFNALLSEGRAGNDLSKIQRLFTTLAAEGQMDINEEQWKEWVSGTVAGTVVPVKEAIDSTYGNVCRFIEYINDIISQTRSL